MRAVEWAPSSFLQQRPWTLGLGRLDLLRHKHNPNHIPITFHSIHVEKLVIPRGGKEKQHGPISGQKT